MIKSSIVCQENFLFRLAPQMCAAIAQTLQEGGDSGGHTVLPAGAVYDGYKKIRLPVETGGPFHQIITIKNFLYPVVR